MKNKEFVKKNVKRKKIELKSSLKNTWNSIALSLKLKRIKDGRQGLLFFFKLFLDI